MIETFEQWEARRTYRIIRSRRNAQETSKTLIASGLGFDQAARLQDQLQAEWCAANPGYSCWTMDIFLRELETPWVPVAKQQQLTEKGN